MKSVQAYSIAFEQREFQYERVYCTIENNENSFL